MVKQSECINVLLGGISNGAKLDYAFTAQNIQQKSVLGQTDFNYNNIFCEVMGRLYRPTDVFFFMLFKHTRRNTSVVVLIRIIWYFCSDGCCLDILPDNDVPSLLDVLVLS